MIESHEIRLKRLRIRSWRRGMREMDLILGSFADRELQALAAEELGIYEQMLEENDQELYAWIATVEVPRAPYTSLIARIRAHHQSTQS